MKRGGVDFSTHPRMRVPPLKEAGKLVLFYENKRQIGDFIVGIYDLTDVIAGFHRLTRYVDAGPANRCRDFPSAFLPDRSTTAVEDHNFGRFGVKFKSRIPMTGKVYRLRETHRR